MTLFEEEQRAAKLKELKLEEEYEIIEPVRRAPQQNPKSIAIGQFSEPAKKYLYDLIATDTGRSWRDLGRELGIRDGEMDEIEDATKSIKQRVLKMLYLFENRQDNKKTVFLLCEALEKARRKDLSRKIVEYLSR